MSEVHLRRRAWRAARRSLLLALFPSLAAAQSRLDPVVVVGSREPQLQSRSAADIVVIESERIRGSTADSVEDLLRREAGLQLARNGGPGQNAGFFIRGASTNSTVVLVDGVRIGSSTLGQAQFESLSLSQIERIEVLRGPASSLYGADAVGGVVHIFTRRGEGVTRLAGSAHVGGYRSRQGDVAVSGSAAEFDYALAVGRDESRGVSALYPGDRFGSFNPDRDGFRRDSANVRLGYTHAKDHRIGVHAMETRLDARYDAAEFNPPDFLPDASPDFRNRLKTRSAALDYRGRPTTAWTTTLQWARHVDDLTSGGTSVSRFITRREQATWQNALALASDHRLMLAYEHLSERASAGVFASDPVRRNHAGVIGYSGSFGAHALQADLRRDVNSVYGGNTTGRLGYALEIVDGLRLRALAGTSYRAPTFNDLYFPGFGVASVRPERGRSIELGVAWERGTTRASATVYRNRVRDLIRYQPDRSACPPEPPFDFGCAANVGQARLQGVTLAGSHRWGALAARATVDLLDARDLDTGERLARRAAHQETVAVDYEPGAWRVGASLLFVGSRPDAGVVLGGYATVGLRASWRFQPQWRVEARLLNALDRRVEPVLDYQALGRQAWIGVRYDGQGL
ncbi:MAG TPA: TonB-dependent receptor [Caldimonas sp.]|jgi:vitamin B12 transporter|nr:TonB-dependent receptor [Caldimonas sp.]HEX2540477.1 TonB-dependent receptor [Caldimonas sp.]